VLNPLKFHVTVAINKLCYKLLMSVTWNLLESHLDVCQSITICRILMCITGALILVNDQLDTQFFFNVFISIHYMFQATLCSSSGAWWWARGCSKHTVNWNKHIEKELCVKLVVYKNYTEMAAWSMEHKVVHYLEENFWTKAGTAVLTQPYLSLLPFYASL
jgi:hypothetical protein